MIQIEVFVKLAAADPWSFTVFDTLNRKFGLGEILHVDRMKSWRISLDIGDRDRATSLVKRLMRETALLGNPNKDVWSIRGGSGGRRPEDIWERPDDGQDAYVVRVTDRDDIVGHAMTTVLRSRLGITEVSCVTFSTIWLLGVSSAKRPPAEVAHDVATARSWRKGLLANPHFQTAEVFRADQYLCEVEEES